MQTVYFKSPPSRISSRGGVSQLPVDYRQLGRRVRSQSGEELDVYLAFPKIEPTLVDHSTVYNHVYAKTERGWVKMTAEQLNYFGIKQADVTQKLNSHILADALKRNKLSVPDEKLTEAAARVGERFWTLKDTLSDLAQDAVEEVPPEDLEVAEEVETPTMAEDSPITRRDLEAALLESEKRRATPWAYKSVSELSPSEFDSYEAHLKAQYYQAAQNKPVMPPTAEPDSSEPEEIPDDNDPFAVPASAHKAFSDMTDDELSAWEREQKKERRQNGN